MFQTVDTSHGSDIGKTLKELCAMDSCEEWLKTFFKDVSHHWETEKFSNDWDTIILEAPEVTEDFIYSTFIHVGLNPKQKGIVDGLKRVLDMDNILYHGIAWSESGDSIYIISKQRASMLRDEKTRKLTAVGEKPMLNEYLVLAHVRVKATDDGSHGHSLGECTHLMRSYCVGCKAGGGMCYHRAGLLWMQMLHWGEGRPTPKPATSDFCKWIPGSNGKRSCKTTMPASASVRMKLPESNKDAERKIKRGQKRNIWEGVPARYDVFGGDQRIHDLINSKEYITGEKVQRFFSALRNAQKKGGKDKSSDDESEASVDNDD